MNAQSIVLNITFVTYRSKTLAAASTDYYKKMSWQNNNERWGEGEGD